MLRSWDYNESAPKEPEVTLLFKDGKFVGNSGCNSYFAPVKSEGMPGDLSVDTIGTTRKYCSEPAMAIEARFLEQLASAKKFGFMIGQLTLSYPKNGMWGVMVFDGRTPRQAAKP